MMIRWLEDAIQDLRSLHEYITLENPHAANRVAKRILNSVNLLIDQPSIGRCIFAPSTELLEFKKEAFRLSK